MTIPTIGVIGGSGLYDMAELTDRQDKNITTPFGDPSGPYVIGTLRGKRVAFLARHGVDTTLLTTNLGATTKADALVGSSGNACEATHEVHNVWTVGGRYGLAPSMVRTLFRTIGAYDLVHIHWLYNFSCIAAARAALGSGVPYIIQPHGSLDPRFDFGRNFAAAGEARGGDIHIDRFGEDAPGEFAIRNHMDRDGGHGGRQRRGRPGRGVCGAADRGQFGA